MEDLLDTLQPVESAVLTPAEIATIARDWFQKNTPAEPSEEPDDPDYLHAVSKTAKLARYIAENAPKAATARERWLIRSRNYSRLAANGMTGWFWRRWQNKQLGTASPLTRTFTRRCRLSLQAYKKRLSSGVAKLFLRSSREHCPRLWLHSGHVLHAPCDVHEPPSALPCLKHFWPTGSPGPGPAGQPVTEECRE